jgi:hypothetical protein
MRMEVFRRRNALVDMEVFRRGRNALVDKMRTEVFSRRNARRNAFVDKMRTEVFSRRITRRSALVDN